ncbi:MAG: hypothetical protein KGL93_01595 [Gemmatimonadota bacterium]|nr:hypothetical protein [Gemmatimonadota bacterium]
MSRVTTARRAIAARTALVFAMLSAACAGDRATSPGPVTPPPDDPPPVSIAARYTLATVNGHALPVEVYAGVYQDDSTGWFHDLRIVATDGYVDLQSDGSYAHYVSLRTMVDGQLAGTPRYVDYGRWFAVPHSTGVRFESTYRQWPGEFHGTALGGAVQLTQELTGGETGAANADYVYTRASLR